VRRLRQIALQRQGPHAFREADIAAALRLTAVQRSKIRAIEAETFLPPTDRDERLDSPREQRMVFEDRWRAALAQIMQLLTPEQQQIWREMTGEPFRGPLTPGMGRPRGCEEREVPTGRETPMALASGHPDLTLCSIDCHSNRGLCGRVTIRSPAFPKNAEQTRKPGTNVVGKFASS